MESSHEFGPQLPAKEEVIAKFLDVNTPTKEAEETYFIWHAEKQREVDESPDRHAMLKMNVEVAEVLIKSNLFLDAASFCDTAWIILNNDRPEIDEEIQGYLDRLNAIEDLLQ